MQIDACEYLQPIAKVLVKPLGSVFDAPKTLTLLQSALNAGVELPSSCRNGTCRTCLCKVLEGTFSCVIEWPGLSAEEKAQNYCLPCVTLATSDMVIELATPSA